MFPPDERRAYLALLSAEGDVPSLAEILRRPAWMDRAACAGMETDDWFPTRGGDVGPARAICSSCPVRDSCLDFAIEATVRFGIWGATSERERRRLRHERRAA